MFNALEYTDELEKAGFTAEQAKKSVSTWMKLMNYNFATKSDFREFQLVSKGDLRELQFELKGEIRDVESKLEGQIRDLQGQIKVVDTKLDRLSSKLIIQLGALMGVMMTISISVLSLMIK